MPLVTILLGGIVFCVGLVLVIMSRVPAKFILAGIGWFLLVLGVLALGVDLFLRNVILMTYLALFCGVVGIILLIIAYQKQIDSTPSPRYNKQKQQIQSVQLAATSSPQETPATKAIMQPSQTTGLLTEQVNSTSEAREATAVNELLPQEVPPLKKTGGWFKNAVEKTLSSFSWPVIMLPEPETEEQREQEVETPTYDEQIQEEQPILTQAEGVLSSPPPVVALESSSDRVILGMSMESGRTIPLSQTTRRQGTYIIGVNGTGKSTLIANLIVQDIEQGLGVCLLDPHGDLTHDVLSRVPEGRLGDVILLNIQDSEYPFGLNLFQCSDNQDTNAVAKTAGFVMHVFEKVWGVGTETPQLAQVLRNVTFTLIQNPGTTFNEIPLLLQDETVRGKLIGNVNNNQVKLFWTTYNKLRPVDQLERTSSTLNKVDAFLTQPIIAHIVGQSQTTLDFRKIMDSGKILLVRLDPQLEDISTLVGSVIIGQLLSAALSRKDVPEEERKQFNLYADEFQRFATEDFATLLSEARKFGIATTIAHQTRSQLDWKNKGASLNAANKIIFRVTGEDGKELASGFDRTPDVIQIGDEPVRAPTQEACKHLLEKGHPNPQAMAFNRMLMMMQGFLDNKPDRAFYTLSDGSMRTGKYQKDVWLHDSVRTCIRLLNEYFAVVQTTGDPDIPPPPIALETMKDLLRRIKGYLPYMDMLRATVEVLAAEPIMVDTGQYRPKLQQRSVADMEGEIASNLTNLQDHQARLKTVKGETTIITLPPSVGLTGQAFEDRKEQIIEQTRAAYCRPAFEVEQEIAERQAALIEEEEKVQGRREEVEAGKQDGQAQPFRPSRRHKQQPNN